MDAIPLDQARRQSLGAWLAAAREAQGRSLADAEKATRIRRRFLEAIESGQWNQLPSEIVGRGFLRNYARFLGLDPDEAYGRLSGAVQAVAAEPVPVEESAQEGKPREAAEPAAPAESGAPPATRPAGGAVPIAKASAGATAEYALLEEPLFEPKRVPWLRIVGSVLIALLLVVVAFGSWAYWYNPELLSRLGVLRPTPTSTATQAPVARITRITATPSDTPTPTATVLPSSTPTLRATRTATPSPSVTPTVPAVPADGIEVFIHTLDRCWVDVYADGAGVLVGLLEPDEVHSFRADREIRLTIGDGGSLEVTVNGNRLGLLGEHEDIIWVAWTLEGDSIQQSWFTPTVTPGTATAQPSGTKTAEPEATSTPEATGPAPETAEPLTPEPSPTA
jgi:cytoskeleton protein RodZ